MSEVLPQMFFFFISWFGFGVFCEIVCVCEYEDFLLFATIFVNLPQHSVLQKIEYVSSDQI